MRLLVSTLNICGYIRAPVRGRRPAGRRVSWEDDAHATGDAATMCLLFQPYQTYPHLISECPFLFFLSLGDQNSLGAHFQSPTSLWLHRLFFFYSLPQRITFAASRHDDASQDSFIRTQKERYQRKQTKNK